MLFVSEVTNEMIMFIAGLVTGVCLGVLLMAIFNASSYADDISEKLFNKLRNIQYGIEPDTHNWTRVVIG